MRRRIWQTAHATETRMSIYDISMIIIFLGAIWFGYWKGLAWQVASVAAIFLSYFVAVTFPDMLVPYISAEAPFNRFAAMLILFVGTSLIVWTIFASVSKSLKKMELKGFDRQAGALLGAAKGAILCMVVTMFSLSLLGDSARNAISESKSGYYVASGINQLPAILPDDMYQYVHNYVENFRNNIGDIQKNPILDRGNESQQVNGSSSSQFPPQQPQGGSNYSQWQTPASQAGYQAPPQTGPSQWQGSYQSGTFNNQRSNSNNGYQQGAYGNAGSSQNQWDNQYRQPTNGQFQSQPNQSQWQPPAPQSQGQQTGWSNQFPKITEGENGWPNVQFNVDTGDLLKRGADAALEQGKQWLDQRK